jgi:hypothetical protein
MAYKTKNDPKISPTKPIANTMRKDARGSTLAR